MRVSSLAKLFTTTLALAILTLPAHALAQERVASPTGSVSGEIRAASSDRPLAGARVQCGENEALAGADGRFDIALPPGEWTCEISASQHLAQHATVLVSEGSHATLRLLLSSEMHRSETVDVTAPALEAGATTTLATSEIASTAGVADNVFRALQTMPGVVGANEYQSRLAVRGGGPDQNLTVMDGVEIHSPYRLDGVMSAFNPETVTDFELTAGAFSARYGDRLSSILVVHNRDGPSGPRHAGSASMGMTDGNVVMDGTLPGALRGTWVVAARQTYYDLIANRFARTELPGFRDLQARSTIELPGGRRLTLFALGGGEWADTIVPPKNVLPHGSSTSTSPAQSSNSVPRLAPAVPPSQVRQLDPRGIDDEPTSVDGEPSDSDALPDRLPATAISGGTAAPKSDSISNLDRFVLDSHNDVLAATFDSTFGAHARSSTTVSYYVNDEDQTLVRRRVISPLAADRGVGIRDGALRSELTLDLGHHAFDAGFETHLLRTRWDWNITGLRPDDQWSWPAPGGPTTWGQGLPPQLQSIWNTSRSGAWIEDRITFGTRGVARAGLRVDHASVNGETTLSPRLLATWHLAGGRVYLGAGQHYQSPGYEKLVQGDYFFDLAGAVRYLDSQPTTSTATGPVTGTPAPSVTPAPPSTIVATGAQALLSARSLHLVAGIERRVGFANVRVEAYRKTFDRLTVGRLETEQERQARVAAYGFPAELADSVPQAAQVTRFPVSNGRGRAYGVDVVIARAARGSRHALDGWVSYSYGFAQREAWGQRFAFDYDRRHALTLVGSWQARRWLRLAVTERLASGFPSTPQIRRVSAIADSDGKLIPRRDDNGAPVYEVVDAGLAQINSERYPYYARLDARATFTPGGPDGRLTFYLDVINVLNRRIPTVQVLPILPSLGAHWRF